MEWKSGESQYLLDTPKMNRNHGKTLSTWLLTIII